MVERKRKRYRRWMINNFSSRRGFVRTIKYQLLYFSGRYRGYKKIELDKVDRLVFVCKGNICRSAYAESVARSIGCDSISCGVDAIKDAPANGAAIEMAAEHGHDMSQHKTQPVLGALLKESDLLVAMEPWQVDLLKNKFSDKYQYTLLGLWGSPVLPHLQDPYGSPAAYFDKCFSYIEQSVEALSKRMGR